MPLILRCEVEYKPSLTALAATCAAHLSLHATWRSFLPLSTSFIISDQSGRRRGRVLQSEINYGLVASNVGGAVLVGWLVGWWCHLMVATSLTSVSRGSSSAFRLARVSRQEPMEVVAVVAPLALAMAAAAALELQIHRGRGV